MKKLIFSSAILAMTAGVALADSHSVVRMGTEGAYPPYNFINDSGEVDGFERVLGDELCARAGLTCVWVTNEWDSIIPNLTSGNYDTIMAGMSITDERDEVIDFTQNYIPPADSAFVALSDDADLEGGVIAAQTNTIQAGYIAQTGAILLEFATPDDKDFLAPIQNEDPDLMFVGDDVQLGGGLGMGIRETDTELRDAFDAAITSMKEDGTLNALIIEWFGEEAATY
jgi:polar amino acid transport system substrate-binding protein